MDKNKWEYKKIKDICTSVEDGDWIESQDQSVNGIRLIQTGNIGIGEYLDKCDKSKYISEDTFERLNCKEIFAGDCLISRLPDPIGRACIIPSMPLRMITAVDCSILRFKDFVLPSYFVHYTKSRSYNGDINKYATGATRKRISRKNLEGILIPVPSLSDQQRIVAELDCLNEMIAVKQEQLKEFDKFAQSIFYDMFGDGSWDIRKIKDVATVKIGPFGSALHQSDYISGGTPLVNPIHMVNGAIIADNDFTVSSDKIAELQPYLLKTNDVVFGRRGDIGRCALVTEKECGYLCGTGSMYVRFTIDINPVYALKILSSEETKKYLLDNAKGATMLNINGGIVENIEIPLPPLELQQQFADKISAIEAQKELVKQSIAETQSLFDSRMDYYFN